MANGHPTNRRNYHDPRAPLPRPVLALDPPPDAPGRVSDRGGGGYGDGGVVVSIRKDYRPTIEAMLDLCDTTDLLDLAQTLENAAAMCRFAQQNRDEERAQLKFLADIAPWFDLSHPMNAVTP